MKISYNWLKQFIDELPAPGELARLLTDCGLEVEQVVPWCSVNGGLEGLVIAKVLTCERHPNADRLSVTTVDAGDGTIRQIVCGAPNVAAGQTVVVALPGARLFPSAGEPFEIKKSKIRGEVSEGMICAEDEIGLGNSHAGIMILPDGVAAGTPAAGYFSIQHDHVFEIGLTPNRADAASHLGVARDIRAVLGLKQDVGLRLPDVSSFEEAVGGMVKAGIEDEQSCLRYSGIELEDVKVGESPGWLQHRLRSIGLRPVNNVVDVTNYVMHELGQPLHAFDAYTIAGGRIIAGRLNKGTTFVTLDGVERKLSGEELMIKDAEKGLCIAGVFGGQVSGVSEKTSRIFLESACFHPVAVRKAARSHGLHTDSSFRFERGTDPEMTVFALKRAALLIMECAGGRVSSALTDHYPGKAAPQQVMLPYAYLDTLTGVQLPRDEVNRILGLLGFGLRGEMEDGLLLTVPPSKVEVTRPADVVEEILRVYGYNNIPQPDRISITPGHVQDPDREELLTRAGTILTAHGFMEIVTNSLTAIANAGLNPPSGGMQPVEVLNPLSGDLSMLRPGMLLTGLEAVAFNINRSQKDLRLFEYGKSYGLDHHRYVEQDHLALWVTGERHQAHWKQRPAEYDIYHLKSILENIFLQCGLQLRGKMEVLDHPGSILEGAVRYVAAGHTLAEAGQVPRTILKNLDIRQPVWFADIHTDIFLAFAGDRRQIFSGPPRFPEVKRDLSMLLDRTIRFSDIERLAYESEPRLLRQVTLFDVYEGDKIESGKKSYAVSFLLRDDEATLQDKQIDAVMDKLMKQYEKTLGAVIRKA